MKYDKFLHTAPLCLVMLAACEVSSVEADGVSAGTEPQLNAVLNGGTETSRAPEAAVNPLKAAVYMRPSSSQSWNYRHVVYTIAADGQMTTEQEPICFTNREAQATLVAYLPAMESVADLDDPLFEIPDWSNQQQIQQQKDLMIAKAIAANTNDGGAVNLGFYHSFSKIIFNISAAEGSDVSLESLQVSVANMNRPLSYHILTGDIDYAQTNLSVSIPLLSTSQESGIQVCAIVPPEESGIYTAQDRIVTFSLSNGMNFKWEIPSSVILARGNSYLWNAEISAKDILVTDVCPDIEYGEELQVTNYIAQIEITPATATISVNEELQLTATISPSSAVNQEVAWFSSDPEIATVDNTGKVKGLKNGEVTITANTRTEYAELHPVPYVEATATVIVSSPYIDWTDEPSDSTEIVLAPIRK